MYSFLLLDARDEHLTPSCFSCCQVWTLMMLLDVPESISIFTRWLPTVTSSVGSVQLLTLNAYSQLTASTARTLACMVQLERLLFILWSVCGANTGEVVSALTFSAGFTLGCPLWVSTIRSSLATAVACTSHILASPGQVSLLFQILALHPPLVHSLRSPCLFHLK